MQGTWEMGASLPLTLLGEELDTEDSRGNERRNRAGMTYEEIGAALGIGKTRAEQIVDEALYKLRVSLGIPCDPPLTLRKRTPEQRAAKVAYNRALRARKRADQ